MSQALFAWEGFAFSHPADWAPVSLTGGRDEGYVRLQGSKRIGGQVRWRRTKGKPDLQKALDGYFSLLERDAKKARLPLRKESDEEDGRLLYRWTGQSQGRGALFAVEGRVFFVEVTGGKQDSLLPHCRALLESFRVASGASLEPWALFGFTIHLPAGLSPATKTLQSGRTALRFLPRGARIDVERYAFGTQLVQRHGLEAWARGALAMRRADADECQEGLRLSAKPSPIRGRTIALVRHDEDANHLIAVKSNFRSSKWEPEWRWIA